MSKRRYRIRKTNALYLCAESHKLDSTMFDQRLLESTSRWLTADSGAAVNRCVNVSGSRYTQSISITEAATGLKVFIVKQFTSVVLCPLEYPRLIYWV